MNGRSPCRVPAQPRGREISKVHAFASHNIWYDPARRIGRGQPAVHVDPRSPERCHVDLSFLPEAG